MNKSKEKFLFEETARRVLEKYFQNEYLNLKRMKSNEDKPDLQSLDTAILGVEVTRACDQQFTEASKLFNYNIDLKDEKKKKRNNARINQLVQQGVGFIITPIAHDDLDTQSKLLDAYEEKLKKLNTIYKRFNRNELFIFNEYNNLNDENKMRFYTKSMEVFKSSTQELNFDKIFILNCGDRRLFTFNYQNIKETILIKEIADLGAIFDNVSYEISINMNDDEC